MYMTILEPQQITWTRFTLIGKLL
uniref:Uncharacterized protein n=1 Tax=Rhizophora mucronata TaxID=61149 RepID=A0A2P2QU63_RHIMU